MDTQFFLPVVHPGFELLKRSAKVLHGIAASIILINASQTGLQEGKVSLIIITQGIIALDIFLLIFFGGDMLTESPRLNLIFRLIETLTLFGIGIGLLTDGYPLLGWSHLGLAAGFAFLFYRERRIIRSEGVSISPTGVILPNLFKDAEISWNDIRNIFTAYHHISIETFKKGKIKYDLRRNLRIDELEQIDEFCRRHIAQA